MKTRFTAELNDALTQFIATASEAEMDAAFENARFNVYRDCDDSFEALLSNVFGEIAASSTFTVYLESVKPSIFTASITSERDVNRAANHEELALAA